MNAKNIAHKLLISTGDFPETLQKGGYINNIRDKSSKVKMKRWNNPARKKRAASLLSSIGFNMPIKVQRVGSVFIIARGGQGVKGKAKRKAAGGQRSRFVGIC